MSSGINSSQLKGEIQMIKSIEIENYKNFKHLKMENFK